MPRYAKGDRVRGREDGALGTVYRVFEGRAVDYCTPMYEILWDHAPGEPMSAERQCLCGLTTYERCKGMPVDGALAPCEPPPVVPDMPAKPRTIMHTAPDVWAAHSAYCMCVQCDEPEPEPARA